MLVWLEKALIWVEDTLILDDKASASVEGQFLVEKGSDGLKESLV